MSGERLTVCGASSFCFNILSRSRVYGAYVLMGLEGKSEATNLDGVIEEQRFREWCFGVDLGMMGCGL